MSSLATGNINKVQREQADGPQQTLDWSDLSLWHQMKAENKSKISPVDLHQGDNISDGCTSTAAPGSGSSSPHCFSVGGDSTRRNSASCDMSTTIQHLHQTTGNAGSADPSGVANFLRDLNSSAASPTGTNSDNVAPSAADATFDALLQMELFERGGRQAGTFDPNLGGRFPVPEGLDENSRLSNFLGVSSDALAPTPQNANQSGAATHWNDQRNGWTQALRKASNSASISGGRSASVEKFETLFAMWKMAGQPTIGSHPYCKAGNGGYQHGSWSPSSGYYHGSYGPAGTSRGYLRSNYRAADLRNGEGVDSWGWNTGVAASPSQQWAAASCASSKNSFQSSLLGSFVPEETTDTRQLSGSTTYNSQAASEVEDVLQYHYRDAAHNTGPNCRKRSVHLSTPTPQTFSTLLVANLAPDTSPDRLREFLQKYGRIKDVYLPLTYNRNPPRPKGYGFVEFHHCADAMNALKILRKNRQEMNLKVASTAMSPSTSSSDPKTAASWVAGAEGLVVIDKTATMLDALAGAGVDVKAKVEDLCTLDGRRLQFDVAKATRKNETEMYQRTGLR